MSAEEDTNRVVGPEVKIPIVRVKVQPRRHKVISFGYMVTTPVLYEGNFSQP